MTHKCDAYQVSDQMTCPACRLTWDMNDTDPPPCGQETMELEVQAIIRDRKPGWVKRAIDRRFNRK